MVFYVREPLTEEDRAAWRRLAAHQKRDEALFRRMLWIGYGVIWGGWLMLKLFGLVFIFRGVTFLSWAVTGELPLWMGFTGVPFAALMVGCGICLLLLFPRSPGWPSPLDRLDVLSAEVSDTPVRAAFFGDGCFAFWDASGKARLGYSSIAAAWEDEGRFYLFFQNRPPLVLPKRGFSGGEPEAFRNFLEREQGVPVERTG